MRIIDISQAVEIPMAAYPSLPKFERKWIRHYDNGHDMCASVINMASHTGAHMDSPYHYCEKGRKILEIEIERYYGICQVVEVPEENKSIDIEFLKKIKITEKRVLFKTTNSKFRYKSKEFQDDFVYLEGDAAKYLIENKVNLIGIDYCSIDPKGSNEKPAHHAILDNDGSILEGIDLDGVEEGKYILSCLPIKIEGSEGAPCRAVLIKE